MKELTWLKRVLEASVRRRGEQPLTNAYLLNIVNMAIKAEGDTTAAVERLLDETMAEDKKWGSS